MNVTERQQILQDEFKAGLWDQFEVVAAWSQASRTDQKELLSMLETRCKVETNYADKLSALYTNKYDNRPELHCKLMRMYVDSMKLRADQSRKIARLISQDVLLKLKDQLESSSAESKRVLSHGRNLEKQLESLSEDIAKTKHKYNKKLKDLEESRITHFVAKTCGEYGNYQRTSSKQKVREKTQQLNEIGNEVKMRVKQFNEFAETYQTETAQLVGQLYAIEKSRLELMINSVMDMELYENSAFRVFLNWNEDNALFLKNVKAEQDLESFLHQNLGRGNPKKVQPVSLQLNKGFVAAAFERIQNKELEALLKYGVTHHQLIHSNKFELQKSQKLVVEKVFKDEPLQQQTQQTKRILQVAQLYRVTWEGRPCPKDEIKHLLDDAFARKDFVMCMQQSRLMGRFEILPSSLYVVVDLVSNVLDLCLKHRDSYNGKQIMVLIFTYFIQDEKKGKLYLHTFLQDHAFFANGDFWEAAFIQSVYEESRQHSNKSVDLKDIRGATNFQKQQNLVFNQLAYYVHNMVLFGISEKEVKSFCNKFIKLYNLDEQKIKHLHANISSALKEEKANQPLGLNTNPCTVVPGGGTGGIFNSLKKIMF